MESTTPPIPEVELLLEASQPRLRLFSGWLGSVILTAVVVGGFLLAMGYLHADQKFRMMAWAITLGAATGSIWINWRLRRAFGNEQIRLQKIEEFLQLRRWPEALVNLVDMLMRPMVSPVARVQALMYMSAVLSRYHRFEDVIYLDDYLLGHINLDDDTASGVKMGRTMALLRDDNLLEADRALSELSRSAGAKQSAGLALLALYRDVKTGHAAEALDGLDDKVKLVRDQMGHRVADVYALAARAYDFLSRPSEAQAMFSQASLMTPLGELVRRYPELQSLIGKYVPHPAPLEVR